MGNPGGGEALDVFRGPRARVLGSVDVAKSVVLCQVSTASPKRSIVNGSRHGSFPLSVGYPSVTRCCNFQANHVQLKHKTRSKIGISEKSDGQTHGKISSFPLSPLSIIRDQFTVTLKLTSTRSIRRVCATSRACDGTGTTRAGDDAISDPDVDRRRRSVGRTLG
jgi:hypothetical protein